MNLYFSTRKFKETAPKSIKRMLNPYLDALDGLTVDFSEDPKNGIIRSFTYEGKEHYLYPVNPEWCINNGESEDVI